MSDPQVVPPEPTRSARRWAMLCHLVAVVGLFYPLGNLVAPLAVWLFKRKADPLINDQGKEALNFQIMVCLVWALGMVVGGATFGGFVLAVLVIVAAVLMVIASVKVNKGIAYRYPFIWRLLK